MLLRSLLPAAMSHRRAVVVMTLATLLWATAGVFTRQITGAQGFEITFWRSVLALASMLLLLRWWRGPGFFGRIPWREPVLWLSGLCWATMFTAFMMALSFTTVANVLVLSALGPVFTALVNRFVLGNPLPRRTWMAIATAGAGIFYIYAAQLTLGHDRKLIGSLIALLVPVGASAQWILMQREQQRVRRLTPQRLTTELLIEQGVMPDQGSKAQVLPTEDVLPQQMPAPAIRDMVPALLIGAALSALICLPFAIPFQATLADMGWLALLGMVQLAIPCSMAVVASRVLHAPELSLLALLEIIFGILLTWWGAGEIPGPNVAIGGALVIVALALNEILGWRQSE
ncbi:EamA-like transporter family protein [Brachymonas denitrificans DSM 15123]|jgi:drug/metabolite transporter (DMT)-like permease|uniref:EamA-like transporter family protein n=3 Tax=Brachymonas denitrificans TaxID=28220 RepID=A0A1H8FG77_9BURK|nr:EamA-like transporter family protein [Brachymonas denitrificans DSM 15123]